MRTTLRLSKIASAEAGPPAANTDANARINRRMRKPPTIGAIYKAGTGGEKRHRCPEPTLPAVVAAKQQRTGAAAASADGTTKAAYSGNSRRTGPT